MYVSLLPTSVDTSSCLTVLVPRGDPSPTAPESRLAHAASPRLVVLDVGRGEGRRSCILLLDALPASVGRIVLPLPDPVAPLCVLGPARPQPHLPSDGSRASPPRDVIAYWVVEDDTRLAVVKIINKDKELF